MTTILAYRRQALIREICQHIGYQGRYVWLVPSLRVVLQATNLRGSSRIRFRLLDITEEPKFTKLAQAEGRRIDVTWNRALVALPVIHNRRRILLLFLNEALFLKKASVGWSNSYPGRLTPEEAAVLEHKLDHYSRQTAAVAKAICEYRGLINRAGELSSDGSQYLTMYYKNRSK